MKNGEEQKACVRTVEDIHSNIMQLWNYSQSANPRESEFARDLMKRAQHYIATKVEEETFFAPCKWSGFLENNLADHLKWRNHGREGRNGGVAKRAIENVLGSKSVKSEALELKFIRFCHSLGVKPQNRARQYWILKPTKHS